MFRRLVNLIKGFFGLFVGGLERRHPEVLLEVEKENLRKSIVKFNQSLQAHAGLCERLMAQVRKQEREHEELRAKTTAHLTAGNHDEAGQLAVRLQSLHRELEENSRQLDDAEKAYRELTKARDVSIKVARRKIEDLRRGIDELKVQAAMAELNEMAAGLVTELGGSGDTLVRLQEMVEEERAKARGKARVARDSPDTSEFEVLALEQGALECQALAEFAEREGLPFRPNANLPAGTSNDEPTRASHRQSLESGEPERDGSPAS